MTTLIILYEIAHSVMNNKYHECKYTLKGIKHDCNLIVHFIIVLFFITHLL